LGVIATALIAGINDHATPYFSDQFAIWLGTELGEPYDGNLPTVLFFVFYTITFSTGKEDCHWRFML
jgi:hypothetical protein